MATIRNSIMGLIKNTLTAWPNNSEDVSEYFLAWDRVIRGPIPAADTVYDNVIGFFAGEEMKEEATNAIQCILPITIEFVYQSTLDVDQEEEILEIMADLEKCFCGTSSKKQFNGLVDNITAISNEIDLNMSLGGSKQLGTLSMQILYKHKPGDPRKRPFEA